TGTLQLAAATKAKPLGLFFSGANPVETGPFKSGSVAIAEEDFEGIKKDDRIVRNLEIPAEKIAELAWNMANNKTIDGWNDETTFSLYVAGSSPLGPNYRPERKSGEKSLQTSERWSNLTRQLIWSGNDHELPEKYASFSEPTINGRIGNSSKRLILKALAYQHNKLNSSYDEFQSVEETWIRSLIDTFPTQKNLIEKILVEMLQEKRVEVPGERIFA
ncbi:hypothetical protein K8I28_07130, partial [bacterium]|nr:hypothetical protein [bacterium]